MFVASTASTLMRNRRESKKMNIVLRYLYTQKHITSQKSHQETQNQTFSIVPIKKNPRIKTISIMNTNTRTPR